MHCLLKHKMLQFVLIISLYMAPTCLTNDFKETVTLVKLHLMLPDDGP